MNSREKAFNKILSKIFGMCFTWRSNNETAWCAEGPEFDSGYNLFFFFFSSFLFFSFPLRLVFILVFVVFFYLFIWLMFFLDL